MIFNFTFILVKIFKIVLDNTEGLTMDEIVAQCFIFFLGGYETSSTTMTFAAYELATHPEMQEKLRLEIHQVLKKYDNQLTYDSLKELEYMNQVIDGNINWFLLCQILC